MISQTKCIYTIFILVLSSVTLPAYCMDKADVGGEIVGGLPCVKRLNQLFCGSAGNTYPREEIDTFIDDNKALLRRMYGELQDKTSVRVVRTFRDTRSSRFRRDVLEGTLEEMLDEEEEEETIYNDNRDNVTVSVRTKRQSKFPGSSDSKKNNKKEDVCQSKVEIVTPYWASNSNGKVRAILNNKEFEQAVHQEICSKASTPRCNRDCTCEQKYKWHRLLSYDPNNDCSGIFMDWFLFPSCCTCRCSRNPFRKT